MKVKIFDFEHENDLEMAINEFVIDKNILNIDYQTSHYSFKDEQIYSFSALIIYKE